MRRRRRRVMAEAPDPAPLAGHDRVLAQTIDSALACWPTPGLAVVVVQGFNAFVHVRGVRAAGEQDPIEPTTPFDLCSVGKAFTALALAQAAGEGRLSLDDPVARHLPGWRLHDQETTRSVRLRDLLAHRLGLDDYLPAEAGLAGAIGARGLLERMRGLAQRTPLRAGFTYANTNYIAAHAALCHAAGPLEECLAPLLQRIGMPRTHFDAERFHADPARARWHAGSGEAGPLGAEPVWPGDRGAGSVYTCALDLVGWLRFLVGVGPEAGGAWRAALDACTEPQVMLGPGARRLSRCAPDAVLCTYALGWAVSDLRGRRVVMHGGEMPGTRAWIGCLPDAQTGVAVLANASRPITWAIGHLVLRHLLGEPRLDWVEMARRAEADERARWAAGHARAVQAALAAGAVAPQPGRWMQAVAGAVHIATTADAPQLRFEDVPFWNGRVHADGALARVRFDDPAARDIFAGLEPPVWQRPDGTLELADFGRFAPS